MSYSFLYPLSLSPVSPSQGNFYVYFSLRTLQLDEMVGWHHRFNGHEFEQTPGNGEGPGSLACCSPWGHKEPDMTERLNNSSKPYEWGQKWKEYVKVGVVAECGSQRGESEQVWMVLEAQRRGG